MKLLFLIILITVFAGCNNTTNKKNIETEQIAERSYLLISREHTNHIDYNPEVAKNPDSQQERDLFFSKELLRRLDPVLTKYDYKISINSEAICSPDNDTLSVTIYDFIGKPEDVQLKKIFEESTFIEKSINILPPPYYGLYFLNMDNLCVVVMEGIAIDPALRTDLFMNYIKEETIARLPNIKISM